MRVPRAMPQGRRTRQARPAPAARQAAGRATASAAVAPAAHGGRAPRAPFVLLVVGLLCGGLVSLLLLNTILAQDSFRASELRNGNNQLRQKKEELKHQNSLMDTPEWLAKNAENQGQRPDWDEVNAITPDRPGSGLTTDRSTGDRTGSDRSTTDGTTTDRSTADRSTTDGSTTDRSTTGVTGDRSAGGGTAGDGQTPAGQERVAGTGR
ncbi:hypothetical protein [Streptosporangium sp. NPDC051022]|uniref:hypothetical protein n=1 Tax=Streptosporangium sp. NPDC051022 TaxID=3155752 RepID=UPI0034374B4E